LSCGTVVGMANVLHALLKDLADEGACLLAVLDELDPVAWAVPTASVPWTIADQVSHLAWNDDATVLALTEPTRFLRDKPTTPDGIQKMVDRVIVDNHDRAPADLLQWFRGARRSLLDSFAGREATTRMPWYGPEMSLASKLTARFMETWAHGCDIYEALGIESKQTDRVRHVVFLGLRAIPNSFLSHGRPVPAEPVRLQVTSPNGDLWQMGDTNAVNVVTGSAWDLALLVTQRVHLTDTNLRSVGDVATEWLQIAQAFAGPPGAGRPERHPERQLPRQLKEQ
jgi:uncharacterized protein (TIGR03084 family)